MVGYKSQEVKEVYNFINTIANKVSDSSIPVYNGAILGEQMFNSRRIEFTFNGMKRDGIGGYSYGTDGKIYSSNNYDANMIVSIYAESEECNRIAEELLDMIQIFDVRDSFMPHVVVKNESIMVANDSETDSGYKYIVIDMSIPITINRKKVVDVDYFDTVELTNIIEK